MTVANLFKKKKTTERSGFHCSHWLSFPVAIVFYYGEAELTVFVAEDALPVSDAPFRIKSLNAEEKSNT